MTYQNKKTIPKGHTYRQWTTAIIVNMVLLSYGLQIGWISPVTKVLQSENSPLESPTSDSDISWIASVICLSASISAPFYSYIADKYGRKSALFTVCFIQTISWSIKLFANNVTHLLLARTLCGVASGGCFNIAPVFTKEISQDNIRGRLSSLTIMFQNLGIFIMYTLGTYLEYYTVLWIVIPIPVINMLLLLTVPESPSFLVKIGRVEQATSSLSLLRGSNTDDKVIQNEVNGIINSEVYFKSIPKITFWTVLKDKAYRKMFVLSITMITVAALNGNFAITTYAASIMETAGATVSPELQTLSFPIVSIAGSVLSMCFVEKFGRKPILLISLVFAAESAATLGTIIMYISLGGVVPSWLSVLPIIVSVFVYSLGVLPMPYVIMSEILNFQIRSMLMGIVVMYAWIISFTQLSCFASLTLKMGMYTVFYIFALINLVGGVVTVFYIPESKDRTPEQIEEKLRK